jgi:hypothetical protein
MLSTPGSTTKSLIGFDRFGEVIVSLLDKANEDIVIFPEETVTDADGNLQTRPSATGFHAKARIQPSGMSGTSARRSEQDNEGFESEKVYSMRLPRSFCQILGAQSQIVWRGQRWVVFGDAFIFNNSPKTAHVAYTIKRY